jgi:hypothetical protein
MGVLEFTAKPFQLRVHLLFGDARGEFVDSQFGFFRRRLRRAARGFGAGELEDGLGGFELEFGFLVVAQRAEEGSQGVGDGGAEDELTLESQETAEVLELAAGFLGSEELPGTGR